MRKIVNELQARAVLAEADKRDAQRSEQLFVKTPRELTPGEREFYLSRVHDGQRQVLLDPCKRIALLCPRRTGKSTALLFKSLWTAKVHPKSNIAYIVPSSRHHAKRLFWNPLYAMDQQLKLGLDFKVGEHCVITREGTRIYVFGAKNKDAPRVLRGDAWSLGILDECKDFGPHFEELIIEALTPGLEDYEGTLCLAGTPGDVLDGLFYRLTYPDVSPQGWSVHKWNKSVNTFMAPEKRDLDIIEEREYRPMGLTKDSPKFRREQLAIWCTDDTERAYAYDRKRNEWAPEADGQYVLPEGHSWMYVLGLDLGERDANAFVVIAFALTCLDAYVVHEFAQPRMSIDEIAAYTQGLIYEFGYLTAMVADTGGYGRGIVTDLQQRHNLPFEPADKTGNKLGNIAQMNSDFLCGHIKAKDSGPLAAEWKRLVKKFRQTDHKVVISHSDLGDAALYAWKASKHYASVEKPEELTPGTEAWYIQKESEDVARAVRRRATVKEGAWWGSAISDQAG